MNYKKQFYRFHYLYFSDYPFGEMHSSTCSTFSLPKNITQEDAFKVISYFFSHTKSEIGTFACCNETTDTLINNGFKYAKEEQVKYADVIDLFCVINNDNGKLFKSSEYYDKYFEWYVDGVTRVEVENILFNAGIDITSKIIPFPIERVRRK